jgi:hypothetical protein
MSYVITGDKVILQNVHNDDHITIKHLQDGYKLEFDSECTFKATTSHKTLQLGKFTIQLSNNNEELEVKKSGNTLMKLVEA